LELVTDGRNYYHALEILVPLAVMGLVSQLTMGKALPFTLFSPTDDGCLLPSPTQHPSTPQKSKIRVRALLTHCLYRRVLIWTVAAVFLVSLTLFSGGVHHGRGRILGLVDFGKGRAKKGGDNGAQHGDSKEEEKKQPHWMKYKQYVLPYFEYPAALIGDVLLN
jgi:hypothetical protein